MGLTYNLGRVSPSVFTDSSLNVGIGAAPSGTYKLEVTGTAKVSSTLLLGGALSGTSATFSSTVQSSGLTLLGPTGAGTGPSLVWDRVGGYGSFNATYKYESAYFTNGSTLQFQAGTGIIPFRMAVNNAANAGNIHLFPDGDGNVGIGTSSPGAKLHVSGTVEANGSLYRAVFGTTVQDSDMTGITGGNGSEVQIQSPSSTRGAFLTIGGGMNFGEAMGGIAFYNSNNVDGKRCRAFVIGGQEGATSGEQGSYLSFGTVSNTVSIPSERMRITSGGYISVNGGSSYTGTGCINTLVSSSGEFCYSGKNTNATNPRGLYLENSATTGGDYAIYFTSGGGGPKFYVNGNGAIYSTSNSITLITSDVKLKTDIKDYDKGLSEILAMKPRYFKYKNNLEVQQTGFIAQEMEEALAGSMIDVADNLDSNETHKSYQIDWYPLLVKAIQEQQAIITSLQDRLDKAGL